MRKPNYRFERRTREIEKQAKKAAKAEAKREKKIPEEAKYAPNEDNKDV